MKSSQYLGDKGVFSRQIEGFSVRESQLRLSDAIESAIEDNAVLVAEAGTGIGKTFAYLVPAILSGKKVIVSTGTRHLQDQLFRTDIPTVTGGLEQPVKTAILKGRANYLCLHRLQLAPHLGYSNRTTQAQLAEIRHWSKHTKAGDISELSSIAEDAYVWPMVTSTTDNCLGGECDFWNDCFIVRQRKLAQDADLLVINHHLLLADMAIKEEGFAELLPGADVFIIDEAHQLHDVATRFFGDTVSSRQLLMLAKDAIAEQLDDAPDMPEIRDCADQLEKHAQDFRLALGQAGAKQAWSQIMHKPAVVDALDELNNAVSELSSMLEVASERSRGLEQCYQRSLSLLRRLEFFTGNAEAGNVDVTADNSILWYETYTKSFMLHCTPVDVSALFRKFTDEFSASWIFTSATLQVNRDFGHFSRGMGLEKFRDGVWESPFDYANQCLLYLPTGMPEPADPSYTQTLLEAALPVLEASGGRAFLLFTSYRAMNQAAEYLQDRLQNPVLVQGELPRYQLLAEFRAAGNAVLLGTSSFWEGVDVRGEALSCVIIDKLPFASPGDPVMQARIDAIRRAGGQPFMDYQVPQAVITLKQGVGRLIRDVDDRGVIMIGDPRLKTKAYGRVFLNSLPSMPQTNRIDDVETFFDETGAESEIETACH